MNIAVVGGNGLVGSRLIKRLASDENKIYAFVERMPQELVGNCKYIVADLSEFGTLAREMMGKEIDVAVHNAAISHPKLCFDNPYKMYHVNVDGTLNVLEACKLSGVKRFIYISSGAVYGKTKYDSVNEDLKLYPLSPYSASKVAGEAIALNYGMDALALRLSCLYGPGRIMPEPINLLLTEAVRTDRINWPKGIDQSYDYIFVDDCVEAIALVTLNSNHKYNIYNVGGGEEVSYRRIVAAVKRKKPELEIEIGEGDLGYDNHGPFNILRMKEDFGWQPQTSIEEGISLYYDYLINNR